ncbi:unnamed protein product [Prunus armeniaca]|uniref:Uncharacterized protein n=1 Tax=Prunus armeniaca TaxID=36596 RepID=A0A6J5XD39_PRUAR|nr:unnamed protein product [Prunus armeniaca]
MPFKQGILNNDPYSNTYNPGWRNHPNFKWSNNPNVQQSQGPSPRISNTTKAIPASSPNKCKSKGVIKGRIARYVQEVHGATDANQSNSSNAVNKLEVQVGGRLHPPGAIEHPKLSQAKLSGKQVDNKVGDANEEQEDGENVEIIHHHMGSPIASNKQSLNPSEWSGWCIA